MKYVSNFENCVWDFLLNKCIFYNISNVDLSKTYRLIKCNDSCVTTLSILTFHKHFKYSVIGSIKILISLPPKIQIFYINWILDFLVIINLCSIMYMHSIYHYYYITLFTWRHLTIILCSLMSYNSSVVIDL